MNRFACLLVFTHLFVFISYAQSSKPDSVSSSPKDSATGGKSSDPYVRALQNERDHVFEKLNLESEFPGGSSAWPNFLKTHLVYPPQAVRKKIEGTVILGFTIDKDGTILDLKALEGDAILEEAALSAMLESPKWKPTIQNGRLVKSYKRQPVVFSLNGK